MAKQSAKTAKPRLRFPEFRGADGWTPTPLGELGTFIRGLTYVAADVQDDGLLVVRSTNIQDGQLVLDKDFVFVEKNCSPEQLLQVGDIAICMSNGSKSLVGKSAEFDGDYDGSVTVGAFCSIFRPSLTFTKLAFKSDRYAEFVAQAIGGGNINNLKNSDLESFEFAIPVFLGEQQKVADCLTSLDEVVAAQGRKVETLKAHKRGLMQQLFPREGETRPRLRFPEFRDAPEWRGAVLGDVCRPQQWQTISSSELTEHGYPVYGANGYIGRYPSFNHEFETVAVTCRGSTCGEVLLIPPKSYITGNSMCLDEIDYTKHSHHFIFHLLKHRGLRDVISGSAQPQIVGQAIRKLKFSIPRLLEQQRIADCLTSLDTRISAETARFAALKTHKQGLMQQLLPVPEAMGA